MLWVALHFPPLPIESLERIAAWACQFTPKVSLEPPRELLMEVAGSLRRFGGSCGLVMELVSGETLADLVRRRRLPIAESLRLASQIAAASLTTSS